MSIRTRSTCVVAERPALFIRRFTPDRDPARYARFHGIRAGVFAGELGWHLHEAVGPCFDPFDHGAHFFLAETTDGRAVGTLRALTATRGFPHRELFARELAATGLVGCDAFIGTLNALAVLPEHRGRLYRSSTDSAEGTAAHLLLRSALAELQASGVRVVFATVLGTRSARSFLRVGFRLLDPPQGMPGQDRFIVANVGAVLPSSGDAAAMALACVHRHFARRHRQVTAMGTIDELFQQMTPVRRAPEASR